MDAREQLVVKRALETLDPLAGGLPADALFDQVERYLGETLTTLERARAQRTLLAKQWALTYRNPLTDRVYLQITPAGSMALIAL